MKTPETLLIIGAAALGVYALSKQNGEGLGGITNIMETPGGGGGSGLFPDFTFPAITFPSINFPDFSFPDFNLPSVEDIPTVSDIGLPDLPDMPKLPTLPTAQGAGEWLGRTAREGATGLLAGTVQGVIGEGAWNAWGALRTGDNLFDALSRMANTMKGGGMLGGVSPGVGITQQAEDDPNARLDVSQVLAMAAYGRSHPGEDYPGAIPGESAARKPGATAPDTQGEASAKMPDQEIESMNQSEIARLKGYL